MAGEKEDMEAALPGADEPATRTVAGAAAPAADAAGQGTPLPSAGADAADRGGASAQEGAGRESEGTASENRAIKAIKAALGKSSSKGKSASLGKSNSKGSFKGASPQGESGGKSPLEDGSSKASLEAKSLPRSGSGAGTGSQRGTSAEAGSASKAPDLPASLFFALHNKPVIRSTDAPAAPAASGAGPVPGSSAAVAGAAEDAAPSAGAAGAQEKAESKATPSPSKKLSSRPASANALLEGANGSPSTSPSGRPGSGSGKSSKGKQSGAGVGAAAAAAAAAGAAAGVAGGVALAGAANGEAPKETSAAAGESEANGTAAHVASEANGKEAEPLANGEAKTVAAAAVPGAANGHSAGGGGGEDAPLVADAVFGSDLEKGIADVESWEPKQKKGRKWLPLIIGGVLFILVALGATLGALFGTGVIGGKSSSGDGGASPSGDSGSPPVMVPAPPPSVISSVLGGICDSSEPPLLPDGATAMPSYWWSNELKNGSQIQLLSVKYSFWLAPAQALGNPGAAAQSSRLTARDPIASSPSPSLAFTVVVAPGATGGTPTARLWVALGTNSSSSGAGKGGWVKVLGEDVPGARVGVVQGSAENGTELTVTQVGASVITLRTPRGNYISVPGTGRALLLRSSTAGASLPTAAERFRVRHAVSMPAVRGVNMGGWLVAERWMDPSYFDGVPAVMDGVVFALKSPSLNLYLRADLGSNGRVAAMSQEVLGWEHFYWRIASSTGGPNASAPAGPTTLRLNVRANNGSYWTGATVQAGGPQVYASAAEAGADGLETFTFHFAPGADVSAVISAVTQAVSSQSAGTSAALLIEAPSGKFLRVRADGNVTADYTLASRADLKDASAAVWGADSPARFLFEPIQWLRGEWQLSAGLPTDQLLQRVARHRFAFITEADFSQLPGQGINTVRIPVGYWILQSNGSAPSPFVSGGLSTLDQAFGWAETYGIRVIICLHAAAGSQNGMDHSASRDGIAQWSSYPISRTLNAIEGLTKRYASSPAFLGIGLLNEPNAAGAPMAFLKDYYTTAYNRVRSISPCAYVSLGFPIDASLDKFDGFMTSPVYSNVMLDLHFYNVFSDALAALSADGNIDFVRNNRSQEIQVSDQGTRLDVIGEWSMALPVPATQDQMRKFGDAQLQTYAKARGGWFFWSLKLNGTDLTNWSFQKSFAKGWLALPASGLWP